MKFSTRFLIPVLLLLALATPRASATPILFSWDLNIDGLLAGEPLPGFVNSTLDWYFDPNAGTYVGTGLGTITVTLTEGSLVGVFFDHEFATNGYQNEYGAVSLPAPAGLSWEIDEPGYLEPPLQPGDIHDNFEAGSLDNTNSVPSPTAPNDVSMAVIWTFLLSEGQTAVATFNVSQAVPTSGFYLRHTDADSSESIYLTTSLDITGPGPGTGIPEPGAILLFLAGGGLLLAMRRLRKA